MTYSKILLFTVFILASLVSIGQAGVAYDLKKPKKFENRILASEKSGDNSKKIKPVRRLLQNTVTHYNYFYNANEKLIQVLTRAKIQFRDDYTTLLPFYNYSLDATAAQKRELDSVIYKCTAGILIHDTRNDWMDNLYMLIGQAYYLRKEFDSAYITFQFLNFAFAPKEPDFTDKPIGSNADEIGNASRVSTVEKRNIVKKLLSRPPSRNEALLWKIRTYITTNRFAEATSLIEVLRNDPQFPARLEPGLAEMMAFSFYRQQIYDSAATYLEKALPMAQNGEEKARWEYLIAQMWEKKGSSDLSKAFYERTVKHTYNPILEIYARLNTIRQNKEGGDTYVQQNIDALVKMARKDRFELYRDIIYYMAAQMELERNNKAGAEALLLQCTKAASAGMGGTQRNRGFLLLANISFDEKKYRAAKNYYDSINVNDPMPLGDVSWLPERKANLATIVAQLQILDRQDSLQRIAAMPAAERDAYIKKLVRTLRKRQGLRDEGDSLGNARSGQLANNAAVTDLFSNTSGTSDWYFNNASLKAKGYNDFKTKWGPRQNVDNWQVGALAKTQGNRPGERTSPGLDNTDLKAVSATGSGQVTFKSLMDNLPLTPEKQRQLNDSVERAMYALGKAYYDGLADYQSTIPVDSAFIERFSMSIFKAEVLLNLYYAYVKVGDAANAARILALLKNKYPNSRATAMASNPDSTVRADGSLKVHSTRAYESIYSSFIEGRFDQALKEKKLADSLYGDKYWTPQLLYIEAVYYIRNRDDQHAIAVLGNIPARFPRTAMAAKASTLIDVLRRRREIEDYLTRLEVKRATDDEPAAPVLMPGKVTAPEGPRLVRNDKNILIKEDTSTMDKAKINPTAALPGGAKPGAPVIAVPDKLKIDTAVMNKAKMDAAELTRLQKQQDSIAAAIAKAEADSVQMAILRHRADSIEAVVAKLRADSIAAAARIRADAEAAAARVRADSIATAARIKAANTTFTLTPDKSHAVIIVLDKVDPVYVTETRNAFSRWNLENFYGQNLTIANSSLTDSLKLVIINTFENSAAAMDYLSKAKAAAPREVVPWLPAGKYSFLPISTANLELLMSNKDMTGYRRFLATAYPDLK